MSEQEIKEILKIETDCDYKKISVDEIAILENYITNLQEENEKLEDVIKKDRQFYNNRLLDYIEYKRRIDKAIEYIKTCNPNVDLDSEFLEESYISNYGAKELLDILQGSDNNG